MFLVSTYRIFRFAWQSFWRNFWLSIITISIIVLAFISINFLIIINFIADSAATDIRDKIDISIYFEPGTSEEKIFEVQNFLSSLAQVEKITYISQDEALAHFRQEHQNDSAVLQTMEELQTNPLPATLVVKAKNISEYSEIMKVLENSKYSKELTIEKNFENHKIFINEINTISDKINTFGIVISAIFIVIGILIVFNTIRIAMYTHRGEIEIMKLVGANNSFVALPFIIEGIMYAVFACLASIAIIYPIISFIQPRLNDFFGTTFDLYGYINDNFIMIFGIELLGVVILNIIFSWIAVRRYLKV